MPEVFVLIGAAIVLAESRDAPERFSTIFDRHLAEIHRYIASWWGVARQTIWWPRRS